MSFGKPKVVAQQVIGVFSMTEPGISDRQAICADRQHAEKVGNVVGMCETSRGGVVVTAALLQSRERRSSCFVSYA